LGLGSLGGGVCAKATTAQVNRPVPARDAERFVRFMRDISFFVQVDGSWLGQRLGAFGQSRTTGVARFALVSCRQRTLDSGRS